VDYVSIENQRALVEAKARERGYVCEWYEDADRSGRTERHRHGWLSLKRRVNDPDVAAVMVSRLDRAARSVKDLSTFIAYCDAQGVAFVTADGIVDTSHGSALRTMFINMLGAVAQLESDIASERMANPLLALSALVRGMRRNLCQTRMRQLRCVVFNSTALA
jgi:DNA invertase Pin-like site-specific DNA recombinase